MKQLPIPEASRAWTDFFEKFDSHDYHDLDQAWVHWNHFIDFTQEESGMDLTDKGLLESHLECIVFPFLNVDSIYGNRGEYTPRPDL